jgi:hypothetical protein
VVGSPGIQPVEPHRESNTDEQVSPIAEIQPEIRSVDLDLGQSEEWKATKRNGTEIRISEWFDHLDAPSGRIDGPPHFAKLLTVPR